MEPLFNVPRFKVFPHLTLRSQINKLGVKVPPFKVFLSLVFKSTVLQMNLIADTMPLQNLNEDGIVNTT
jgi:hypothetical protein